MPKPIYVLGTGLSHDGSACLLKDGAVCVAIEKERITRVKHDGMNDSLAIAYCLDAAGIRMKDITLIVQNANFSKLSRGNDWFHGPRIVDPAIPTVTISHHLAHAFSAVGTSPFDESAVLIIDGCGNAFDDCTDLDDGAQYGEVPPESLPWLFFEKDSFYEYSGGNLRTLYKDFSPWGQGIKEYPMEPRTTRHSIGGAYQGVSTYVFSGLEDPGKLMGLAPYGRAGVHDFQVFDVRQGRVFLRYDWMEQFDRPCRNYDQFKTNFQYYADIAFWIQREIERALLYVIDERRRLTSATNLCYAGGVALNAVANRRIVTEGPFQNVYIQPAAGDNGLSLGCAYYGWLEVLRLDRVIRRGPQFFGRSHEDVVDTALSSRAEPAWRITHDDDVIPEVAHLLAEGAVVGCFIGGSEFGPRALGHRSILADPRRAEIRDFINREIKDREDFRPFAPAVLAEDRDLIFDCDYESPHMLLVAPVRHEWRERIPAVVHCDGSARLQTVESKDCSFLHRVISEFKALTGVGVLLNTSLNKRRMPIIETPEQALDFLAATALDAIVIDGRLITKTDRQLRARSSPFAVGTRGQ